MSSFYQLTARSLRGEEIALSRYAGQVVLVVNTASQCGLTPQYAGLEALYQQYREQGLVILGFPCNQFGSQEPGSVAEIEQTCLINYGVNFPMFEKLEVNGAGAHPLFQWLTTQLPGFFGPRIRWNFTKFLIGRDGTPIKRFAPITKPKRLASHIDTALGRTR
ncbi:glutathione peroxidase [Uliginosibacterium gangwonense]|uniref:glutathione peroxidase n=1 Tax=Uliginosibacterium gangwonense TaxID=392736 RepID=UPI00036CF761|nr:glutathione peroxidase [Uliginosibacterium gangwonense]